MRIFGYIALAITLYGASGQARAADKNIWYIAGNPQSSDSCKLVRSDVDLEALLKSVGWKFNGSNFPTVDWAAKNVAVLVSTANPGATMSGAVLSPDKGLFIQVNGPSQASGRGIFVVELESRYSDASQCHVGVAPLAQDIGATTRGYFGGYQLPSSNTRAITVPAWATTNAAIAFQVKGGKSGTTAMPAGP
jgi:hypothetical protein